MYNLHVHVGGWKKLVEDHSNYPTQLILQFLSNYSTHLQKTNAGICLQTRKILFIASSNNTQSRLLADFLQWLKTETGNSAEIILASKEVTYPEQLFRELARVTLFYELPPAERRNLKERLSDEVAMVFWCGLEQMDISNFLSFLDVPQLVLVTEHIGAAENYLTASLRKWVQQNTVHFITTSDPVRQLLIKECNKAPEEITLIRPFISPAREPASTQVTAKFQKPAGVPSNAFIVGLYLDANDTKVPGTLPIILAQICKANEIHVIILNNDLSANTTDEISKTGLNDRVHLIKEFSNPHDYYPLLSVFVSISFNADFLLLALDAAKAGLPVICFDDPAITNEYRNTGIILTVPYADTGALTAKVIEYYAAPEQLAAAKKMLPPKVAEHFSIHSEAPRIMHTIKKYSDSDELMLAERPLLCFFTHIYYENSWEEIKYKLKDFDNGKNQFLFSISEACLARNQIIADIKASFKDAYYLVTSNIGKDIGGKMALIDLYLFLGLQSDYIVFLHDKQSPHSIIGESWKKGLFKIIDINNERTILSAFRDPAVGIVGDKERVINEYDSAKGSFRNNSRLSKKLLTQYDINIENFDFLGGSIYWIRSSVIEHFFRRHHPISTRENLEAGNVLDLHEEKLAHTWERMFSWIAAGEGYTIKGL